MSATVHNFRDCLARSHAASDWTGWEVVYRKAFPGFAAMVDHRQDGPHQRAGIDRSVILSNSKQVLVDEKVRGKNMRTGEPYTDIALEYLSDKDRGVPGWVCKPLMADYIAYANLPLGKCYMLPVVQMQSAWRAHGKDWISKYGEREAMNDGWTTCFVAVPVSVLFSAIGACLRVSFDPVDFVDGDPMIDKAPRDVVTP